MFRSIQLEKCNPVLIRNDVVEKFNEEEYDNQLKLSEEFERNYETDFVFI